jgi:hydroxymethylbilane synthase
VRVLTGRGRIGAVNRSTVHAVKIRIATRKSPLALAQTRWVADRIRAHAPSVVIEEVPLVTEGDRVLDVPLAKVGGKGLFVTEVEQALADGRAEIAVHSMKDVPEALADGMELLCVPEREDPHDVIVAKDGEGFFDLRAGARVGTSSLRRAVQLHAARNDLAFAVLRGNVGTRLRKLDEGEHDAIVLASAGLRRLGLAAQRKVVQLGTDVSIPAVGQGALGIEGKSDATTLRTLLAPLEHAPTRVAVEAERAFLVALHGSCTTPLAAHARIDEGSLAIDGMVGALDGSRVVRASMQTWIGAIDAAAIVAARRLGRDLAERLLAEGARELIDEARRSPDPYAKLYAR